MPVVIDVRSDDPINAIGGSNVRDVPGEVQPEQDVEKLIQALEAVEERLGRQVECLVSNV